MTVSIKALVGIPRLYRIGPLSSGLFVLRGLLNPLLCGIAGAVASLGFAPHYLHWISFCGLALGVYGFSRQDSLQSGLAAGFLFGAGLYAPATFWLFAGVDHTYEHLFAILAPSLLILGLMLSPMVMSVMAFALRRYRAPALLAVLPGVSVAFEFARHHGALAFPWLSLGYAQIPDGPFAGYSPLLGIMGVGWVQWMAAGCVALLAHGAASAKVCIFGLMLMLLGMVSSSSTFWTQPVGKPISIALLQGSIRSEDKFKSNQLPVIQGVYDKLMRSVAAQLVVMPETAWPVFESEIPEALERSTQSYALESGADVLVSHLMAHPDQDGRYFAVARNIGVSGGQEYLKRRLVPFGEYIPFPWLFQDAYEKITKLKLLDTSAGPADQPMPVVAGHRAAIRLCYEDLFAGEAHEELAIAHFVVGMVNDDWFDSTAPLFQHLQASQARALESEKPYLRASNTGVTALIDERGHVTHQLPTDQPGVLAAALQPRSGSTPYNRHGDLPVVLLSAALLVGAGVKINQLKNDKVRHAQ
jgi:apolipoprotein N-acyltransferase